MYKGRKFKKAEEEFAQQTKSFDKFCAENNIVVEKPTENKASKRKVWIGVASGVAAAAVIVCCFIPLMRQAPAEEYYYSEIDVSTDRITIDDIINDSSRDYKLFNVDYIDSYAFAQSIYPNNSESPLLGYNVKDVLWYREFESVDYIFEFDYVIRTDRHYRFKNIALFNDYTDTVNKNNVSFKYRIVDNEFGNDVYITYDYNDVDYFVHMFETDLTSEYSKNNIETFIKLAFEDGE